MITAEQKLELIQRINRAIDAAVNYSWSGAGHPEDAVELRIENDAAIKSLFEYLNSITEN